LSAPARSFRVRRGRVRFKSGCELHVLPSFRERCTNTAHAWLDAHVERAKAVFADDMAGYLLIPWASDGEHKVYARIYGRSPNMNTLPVWTAEAVRRHIGHMDLDHRLGLPDMDGA
jgi:hypothetical protein